MAKKKEFFSTFDKNLSIKEEVAVVNKQSPKVVKTQSIAAAVTSPTPAPSTPDTTASAITKAAPIAPTKAPTQSIIKKKAPAPATPPQEIVKNTTLAKPTTFRIDVDLMENIKAVAYWERKKIQDVLDEALRTYMEEIPKQELTKARKAYSAAN